MSVFRAVSTFWIRINLFVRALVVLALPGILLGCAGQPLATHYVPAPASVASASASSAVTSMRSQTLADTDFTKTFAPYRLGPNDVISVSVYLHPELSMPQPGSTIGNGGVTITSDGTVGLPMIGSVKLGGLTINEAQKKLTAAYGVYVNNTNVTVDLVSAQSLRYYLLGDFSQPGVKYPGRELNLLDALSLGGSLNIANADLYQAYVAQGQQKLPIDIRALLLDGNLSQNIMLRPGSTIVIPPASQEHAFVFGSVGKPGPVAFEAGRLTLLQALSGADMDLSNYASARLSQVRVIRSHGAGADFIIVDAAKILHGDAAPFPLQPGDIVFIPPTDMATWNQVLAQLIPSLTTISGVLSPFVSIAYLSRNHF